MRPAASAGAFASDLGAELKRRVYTLYGSPTPSAGLELVREAPDREAGWKLFLLVPRMLLYRERGQTRVPPEELTRRVDLLSKDRWDELL